MAQDFSYRYPLIDGQGNWGSMDDPKSFAAMRYTESRLQRYAELLLSELDQGTADWVPPHNLREVVAACIRLLDQPKTGIDELCELVHGPDYPTKAEIITSP